jgi:hypothetical protein
MVLKSLPGGGFCGFELLDPIVLDKNGANQFLSRGKIIGKLVVKMAMKVSRVPQEAVSSALLWGS